MIWSIALFAAAGVSAAESPKADQGGASQQEREGDRAGEGCRGGTCPFPSPIKDGQEDGGGCGLWLGPSPIKEHHEHGFGLGMFTGKAFSAGDRVDPEILILIHNKGGEEGWDAHPPLREYVWDGDNVPEVPLEAEGQTMLFLAGVAAIAPCTSKNFNLALRTNNDEIEFEVFEESFLGSAIGFESDHGGLQRSRDPSAGSFSYRHSASFVAVRDIVPGEELTVECSDDDFDGGAYELHSYNEAVDGGDAVVCLDDRATVKKSEDVSGRGLFAKRNLEKGSVVTSTPLIPIARDELDVVAFDFDGEIDDGDQPSGPMAGKIHLAETKGPDKQLLLNYCFGHPDSDLLLLPYGPLVSSINHPPEGKTANVEIRWHDSVHDNAELPRRQQHHHPELLDMPAAEVAQTHGKGLMADFVALRDVEEGEELYVDYGAEWAEAWREHAARWGEADRDEAYAAPSDVERAERDEPLRTADEQEDSPYPSNVRTVCHYAEFANDWIEADTEEENDDWANDDVHPCLAPCAVLERYTPGDEDEIVSGDGDGDSADAEEDETEEVYLVEIFPTDEDQMSLACLLDETYILANVPRRAVRLLGIPYESDLFLPDAFRREIGVSAGFYPEAWIRKKKKFGTGRLLGRADEDVPPTASADDGEGDEFKRKKSKRSAGGIGNGEAKVDVAEKGRIS